ncbi:class I SAM-dependent methyltransferase [Methylocystis sp. WRRC1]|uniref:class I SAM-dependent methyltransferase n=1 Tax=Methylocystis sp. WRRC1 TaxID=1732014 RepID=UPI001D1339B7|nr:class I SAM-dependent methyltransferase [Methylocystis sp. WRRC1]MCC3246483.1 class I SAM-dependent methyltransferase [Methylocystis sp. WRRC1]
MDILRWQADQGITGNLLEIGVFCGKYFAVLVDSAIATDSTALGIDTFQYSPEQRVVDELGRVFGPDGKKSFAIWRRQSSSVTPHEIAAAIQQPRFISIDGAHDFENVYRDLLLCEQVLGSEGVIAVDDFLNPLTIGVNQAVNAFLSTPRAVVPVAYISNKLFLAHRSNEDRYRSAIESMIMEGDEPQSVNFRTNIQKGRHNVEQDFHGHKIVLS